jgi:hypothetical protein
VERSDTHQLQFAKMMGFSTRSYTLRDAVSLRGLDPRIHRFLQKAFFQGDGLPDQARQ